MSTWTDLAEMLRRFADLPQGLPIWWRDDDAQDVTPQLDRLMTMAQQFDVPVHLAVVPQGVRSDLGELASRNHDILLPVVHGLAHRNHEPEGRKKAEFGDGRPLKAISDDLGAAILALAPMGDTVHPMFVPPWNRIGTAAVSALAAGGFTTLSTYGPRRALYAAPGVEQVNTHIDPIDWHGTRSVLDTEVLLARLLANLQDRLDGTTDGTEPLGLLTHHLVHDDPIWAFTERLMETLCTGPVSRWTMTAKGPRT